MNTATENMIAAQKRKIEVIDDRIGRLMSQRVTLEEKLAELYKKQDDARSQGSVR